MEKSRIERLADNAFFVIESSVFNITVSSYDEIISNQTILFTPSRLDKRLSPILEIPETQEEESAEGLEELD